jgi:hypothetical protein
MAKKVNNNWLVFVDTNIFLDFYRKDGGDAVKQIEALGRHIDRLILTDQVFMEFLKNRQLVIAASMAETKRPESHKFPPILRDLHLAAQIEREIQSVKKRIDRMIAKNVSILTDPKKNDPVYKGISTIFDSPGPFFLKRESDVRFSIRRLALKRFLMGYPPRKNNDTSIGDAINWEWIVRSAASCTKSSHVMIVSRDSDFGYRGKTASYLNDWLSREFKERVGKERKVLLTAKLTDALKILNEAVSKKEELAESELLSARELMKDEQYNVFD